jgi:CTP:phosphocholine cytidylyltransferase-like protein
MNCVIIGDKYNKGMKSKGCPGLIPYNKSKNTLEHQYNIIKSVFPDINIFYIYGFDDKKFKEFISDSNLEITPIYNSDFLKYNQGKSLSIAKDALTSDCLIINGYKKLSKKDLQKIKLDDKVSKIILSKNTDDDYYKPGCLIVDDKVSSFGFYLNNTIEEIYYLDKESSKILATLLKNHKYQNYFIFELLNHILSLGQVLKPVLL